MNPGRADRTVPSAPRTPAPRAGEPSPRTVRRTVCRALLRTADGVTIDARYEAGAAAPACAPRAPGADDAAAEGASEGARAGRAGVALVVAHGFTGDLQRPHIRRIAQVFAQYADVITFSFRGHGRSGGHSTVGDREVLDLAAAVGWARRLGYRRVATVGFSMGGSVVLRHAALHRAEACAVDGAQVVRAAEPGREGRTDAWADAAVSVSGPARWYYRGTAPMRRLHWLVTRPVGRAVGRYGFRTRIHPHDWDPVPLSPVAAVPLIAPTPLLVVHGDQDPYFPLDHPRMLAEASRGAAELWVERGMGHAEHAAGADLLERIARWAVAAADRAPGVQNGPNGPNGPGGPGGPGGPSGRGGPGGAGGPGGPEVSAVEEEV
ncbi:alpha/beta hydrolase [Streptomyces sulfonofaciens]|uniref:alpha/beta hydrolase n=1 Tax=Streptomyces sulfonofaciens TaxID=68272 RepID=UPI001677E4F9